MVSAPPTDHVAVDRHVGRHSQEMGIVCEQQARPASLLLGDDRQQVLGHHLGTQTEQCSNAIRSGTRHRGVIAQESQSGA